MSLAVTLSGKFWASSYIPPKGSCVVCEEVFRQSKERVVKVSTCGHEVHQKCLRAWHQFRQEEIKCPGCLQDRRASLYARERRALYLQEQEDSQWQLVAAIALFFWACFNT